MSTYTDIIASDRYSDLCAQLRGHDHGDGGIGIIVAQALRDDPAVTYDDVLAIVVEAEEDAAADGVKR